MARVPQLSSSFEDMPLSTESGDGKSNLSMSKLWSKLFDCKKIVTKLEYLPPPSRKSPNRAFIASSKEVIDQGAKK